MSYPIYKEKYPHLFTPLFVGKNRVEYKNRIFAPPMGSGPWTHSTDGQINDYAVEFYGQLVRGGFASIAKALEIPKDGGHSGALSLDPSVNGFVFMHNLQRLVHLYRARSSCEIYHAGCCMLPGPNRTIMSASSFVYNGNQVKEMDEDDMEAVAKLYENAAFLAKRAGFDAILLHYGHGWLMNQFLSPLTNHRKDKYGGSVENRCRFPLMVLQRVRKAVGDAMPIEIRMNGSDRMEGGIDMTDAVEQALIFQETADMLHFSCGSRLDATSRPRMHPTCFIPPAHNANVSEAAKKAGVRIPVGVVGQIQDADLAERLIAEGKADYILMGRQAVADPDFVNKVREGREEDIRPCIRCDFCLDGNKRSSLTKEVTMAADYSFDRHCAVNPYYGQIRAGLKMIPPAVPKKVAVIGGGIAGLEAAMTAAERGHKVVLFEKTDRLGGQTLMYADRMWFKNRISKFREYLIRQVRKNDVEIRLNTYADRTMAESGNFDAVIVAVGAKQVIPPIPGIDGKNVVMAWDMFGREGQLGKRVVIVGGGAVGCETAVYLSELSHELTVLEMGDFIAATAELSERMSILDEMEKHHVTALTETKCLEITDDGVVAMSKGGERSVFPADSVVVCAGTRPLTEECEKFTDCAFDVIRAGDCNVKAGTIMLAVESGWGAATIL